MARPRRPVSVLGVLVAALFGVLVATGRAEAADRNILMLLWRGETETEAYFKARLQALGLPGRFTVISADQNRTKLATSLRELEGAFATRAFDVVYSYGTTVTEVAIQAVKQRIPIVFNIVFDPVGAQLTASLEKPGRNITGVTNGVPIAIQFEMFARLVSFDRVCLLFNPRETNAMLIEAEVRAWAERQRKTLSAHRIAPGTDAVDGAIRDIRSGKIPCDILYAGADTYVADVAPRIAEAIGDRVPLFGGTATFVARGWLGAYAPSLADMGATAADQAARVLSGADAGDLPVILPPPRLHLSRRMMAKHAITLPPGLPAGSHELLN